jgi:hypothetical protein
MSSRLTLRAFECVRVDTSGRPVVAYPTQLDGNSSGVRALLQVEVRNGVEQGESRLGVSGCAGSSRRRVTVRAMGSGHLTEDQLRRYFLGEGDSEEAAVVEEHLLMCDQCARMALHVEAAVDLCRRAVGQGGAVTN